MSEAEGADEGVGRQKLRISWSIIEKIVLNSKAKKGAK